MIDQGGQAGFGLILIGRAFLISKVYRDPLCESDTRCGWMPVQIATVTPPYHHPKVLAPPLTVSVDLFLSLTAG